MRVASDRKMQVLECSEGHEWQREMIGGKRPKRCPDHRTPEERRRAEYYRANRETFADYRISWRESNRDRARDIGRKYYQSRRQKYTDYQRERRREAPEIHRAQTARHRSRRRAAGYSRTLNWTSIWAEGSTCHYCGLALDPSDRVPNGATRAGWVPGPSCPTLDHLIPISGGGMHTVDNIVLSCRSCNSSKNVSSADEFISRVQERGEASE